MYQQIVIEGERKDYRGDVAIDDVSLIGCLTLNVTNSNLEMTSTPVVETTAATLIATSNETPILINLTTLSSKSNE